MTASPIDLTTLAQVRSLLGITNNSSDDQLQALITGASQGICNYTGRPSFAAAALTDLYDGNGRDWMLLRQWPVQSVTSISYDTTTITAQATGSPLNNGYYLEPILPAGGHQRLSLFGYCFPRGRSNVFITYTAGYNAIPADVAQVCEEMVCEAYARIQRRGQTSITLAGQQTAAYSQSAINATCAMYLSSYRRVLPI